MTEKLAGNIRYGGLGIGNETKEKGEVLYQNRGTTSLSKNPQKEGHL